MKVFITGGSHIGALNDGFRRFSQQGSIPVNITFMLRPLGGGLTVAGKFFAVRDGYVEIINEKFRKKIDRLPLASFPCDVFGLSTTLYSRPVWGGRDWSRFGLAPDNGYKMPVSSALLRRLIHDDQRHLIDLLVFIKGLGITPFVIEGPRPFRHNQEVELAGAETVLRIDRAYREITCTTLIAKGIPVVHLPEHAYDNDGFMLERYRHDNPEDKTHGNAEFGKLMFQRIIDFVENLK